MAEGIFRDRVEKSGLAEHIHVDSAGTEKYHLGKPPHAETRGILEKAEISSAGMRARQVKESDWDEFDYIVAMDRDNLQDLKGFKAAHDNIEVVKIMDYVESVDDEDVPDPYFTGNFDYVYNLLTEGCDNLLTEIKQTHQFQ